MVPLEKQELSLTAEAVLPVGWEVLACLQALDRLLLLDLGRDLHLPHQPDEPAGLGGGAVVARSNIYLIGLLYSVV